MSSFNFLTVLFKVFHHLLRRYERKLDTSFCNPLLAFLEHNFEFRIFHVLLIMANRRKLREEDISQQQYYSEIKCKQTDISSLYCNNDSAIHPVSKISDYKYSDGNILDEFSQIQKSVSKEYISKDEKIYSSSHT